MSHSSDRSLRRTALHCAARFDSTRLDATHFETRDAESLYQHGAPRVFCALNTRCQYLQRVAPCHFYSHCTLLYCTVYYYILYTVYCTVLYTRSSLHYRSVQSRGAATSRRSCRVSSSRVPALRFPTEGGGRSTRCHPSVIRRRSWRPSQALAERPPLRARAALHEQSRSECPLCAAPRCSAQQLWRSHLKTADHFTGAPSVRNGRTIETAGEPREERSRRRSAERRPAQHATEACCSCTRTPNVLVLVVYSTTLVLLLYSSCLVGVSYSVESSSSRVHLNAGESRRVESSRESKCQLSHAFIIHRTSHSTPQL